MRAAIFGIAAAALLGLAAPSQAAPLSLGQGIMPENAVEQARVVRRTVVRGPRCKTVITKRRGPLGRVTVVRRRTCF